MIQYVLQKLLRHISITIIDIPLSQGDAGHRESNVTHFSLLGPTIQSRWKLVKILFKRIIKQRDAMKVCGVSGYPASSFSWAGLAGSIGKSHRLSPRLLHWAERGDYQRNCQCSSFPVWALPLRTIHLTLNLNFPSVKVFVASFWLSAV